MFQIDLKGQNVFHKYAWEGDLKEMQNTVSHVQKIKSESFCKECLFEIKWGTSFRWSIHPNSAWGSIETITIGETHPGLIFTVFEL